MKIRIGCLTALLAVRLVAASGSELHEIVPGESRWSGHLRPGVALHVKGGLGDIDIVASDSDTIAVDVKRSNGEGVQPRVFAGEGEQVAIVCADWVTPQGEPTRCASKGGLLTGTLKKDARVDLRIAVPRGTSVEAQSDHGSIHIEPLKASVSAKTYYGDLRATADGPRFNAETLQGKTEISVSAEPLEQQIHASVGGDIRIVLPETRRVDYKIYSGGNPLRSVYDLEGGPRKKPQHENRADRAYRELTRDRYSGILNDNDGPWLHLEVFVHGHGSTIEIAAP
jgi:hypothetical protein